MDLWETPTLCQGGRLGSFGGDLDLPISCADCKNMLQRLLWLWTATFPGSGTLLNRLHHVKELAAWSMILREMFPGIGRMDRRIKLLEAVDFAAADYLWMVDNKGTENEETAAELQRLRQALAAVYPTPRRSSSP